MTEKKAERLLKKLNNSIPQSKYKENGVLNYESWHTDYYAQFCKIFGKEANDCEPADVKKVRWDLETAQYIMKRNSSNIRTIEGEKRMDILIKDYEATKELIKQL